MGMKRLIVILITLTVLTLCISGCGNKLNSWYVLEFPEIPEAWNTLLGEPSWRIEWINSSGHKQAADILPGKNTRIEIPVTFVNPVSAWPYWPVNNIVPGHFKPAGALYPYDVSGNKISLSWNAGPDTIFYWELAYAYIMGSTRIPGNFDWPRFRELFETGILSEAVCQDPWLIDWRSVAERTAASGFDRRRLTAKPAVSMNIPISLGPWYSASPFAAPLVFSDGETPVFPIRYNVDIWISEEGMLRCNPNTWMYYSWE
jgi:hypothetical protein